MFDKLRSWLYTFHGYDGKTYTAQWNHENPYFYLSRIFHRYSHLSVFDEEEGRSCEIHRDEIRRIDWEEITWEEHLEYNDKVQRSWR